MNPKSPRNIIHIAKVCMNGLDTDFLSVHFVTNTVLEITITNYNGFIVKHLMEPWPYFIHTNECKGFSPVECSLLEIISGAVYVNE